MFGQSSFGAGVSGGSNTSAFGQPASSGGGLFGGMNQQQNQAQPTGVFGASNPTGGTSLFGSTAPAQTTTPGPFGSMGGTGGFGQPQQPQAGASPFGQTQPAAGGFGAPTNAFGQANTSQTGVGAFGAAPNTGLVGARRGTGHTPFRAKQERDPQKPEQNKLDYLQSISAMPEYQNKSFEELRWEDYQENRTKSTAGSVQPLGSTTTGAGAFGNTGTASTGGFGGFGSTTNNTSGGLFGQSKPAFGSSTPAGAFGSTTNTTGAFGAPKPASTGFGFGTASTTNNTGGGMFGQTQSQPQQSGGLFGQSNTTNTGFGATQNKPFGASTAGSSGFGMSNTNTGSGLFGQTQPQQQTGGMFGQQQQQPQQGTGLFGSSTTSNTGFGSNAGGFGQNRPGTTPSTGFGFGQQQPQTQQTGGLFGQSNTASNTSSGLFGQKPAGTGLFGSSTTQQQPASTGFGFGQTQQPAQQQTGGLFGQNNNNSTTGAFGSTTNTGSTGLFGSNTTNNNTSGGLFGGQSSTGGSAFGSNTAAKPLFGSQPQTNGGAFGQTNNNTTTGTGGGLFGMSQPQQQQQPQQPGTSGFGFGQPQTNTAPTGGLFGSKPATTGGFGATGTATTGGLFGGQQQQQQQPQQTGGLFGAKPAAPATGGLFGNNASTGFGQTPAANGTTTGGLFGQPQQAKPSLFGGASSAPATGGTLGQGTFGSGLNNTGTSTGLFGSSNAAPSNGLQAQAGQTGSLFGGAPTANRTLGTSTFPQKTMFSSLQQSQQQQQQQQQQQLQANGGAATAVPTATPVNGNATSSSAQTRARSGVLVAAYLYPLPLPTRAHLAKVKEDKVAQSLKNNNQTTAVVKVETSKRTHDPLYSSRTDELIIKSEAFAPRAVAAQVRALPAPVSSGIEDASAILASTPTRPSNGSLRTPNDTETLDDRADNEILDDKGYWVSPSQQRLDRMSLRELREVRGFRVGRDKFGFVEFLEPVDLSEYSNIHAQIAGRIVAFAERTFTLYPEESLRPPRGQGLNVKHRVTLYDVFARTRDKQEIITDPAHPLCEKFLKRLKSIANFVSWDVKTGTWTFTMDP